MNEVIKKEQINIGNMIYEIRGKQVMLDNDLANLYKCANGTKTINLVEEEYIIINILQHIKKSTFKS